MSYASARILVTLLAAYAAVGFAVAVAYSLGGVGRLDPTARHAPWGFRLLIAPAALALWPLLSWRWLRGRRAPPEERTAHRQAAEASP